jgi:KipI family sensor histidine kinase inhibitor
VLVEVGATASVHALARAVEAAGLAGIEDVVPGNRSLLIEFDPLVLDLERLRGALDEAARAEVAARSAAPRVRSVPVVYGGELGPDLEAVAARVQRSHAEVAALHHSAEYTVEFIGFAPGFPYLSGLPEALHIPRRETPRERVPAGSVAMAGFQTGIYPLSTPGGWHLIGRTPILLFDPARDPPAYFEPGDHVRFFEIEPSEFERYAGAAPDWETRA